MNSFTKRRVHMSLGPGIPASASQSRTEWIAPRVLVGKSSRVSPDAIIAAVIKRFNPLELVQ
ncbi:MAG: hypothetical protein JWO19_3985 [Bryobacterales bacterium]|nr:hypothetical protein [Bryobacterales bacterium]